MSPKANQYLRFRLPADAPECVAFAYSPLLETVLSLHVLVGPKHHALQHDWVRGARRLPAGLRRRIRAFAFAYHGFLPDFLLPLVPIVFAYLVAHYFSLFVTYGQFIVPLASDPFGRGWDLFGTVDFVPNLAVLAPTTVWYVQVSALAPLLFLVRLASLS